MAEISSWADDIRRERPYTSSWHYVDIPLAKAAYDPTRDCRLGNCVVEKINSFAAVVGNPAAEPQARVEALKFLTHFVADEAQPLHAEDNADKGGNDIPVNGFGVHANLHSIWDTAMVQADDPDAQSLADRLTRQITGDQVLEWGSRTPAEWATESHAIAISAYAMLGNPRPGSTISIPQSYIELERPVIENSTRKGRDPPGHNLEPRIAIGGRNGRRKSIARIHDALEGAATLTQPMPNLICDGSRRPISDEVANFCRPTEQQGGGTLYHCFECQHPVKPDPTGSNRRRQCSCS